jgi:hypothetical protein
MMHPEEFESNEELRDYVIQTIRATGLSQSLAITNPEAYTLFEFLLQRHPEGEKTGVSLITDISIRRFPKANKRGPLSVSDHQFFIIKSDGTENSISWNSCVKEKINPIKKRLNWAMRHTVEEEIKRFKRANQSEACRECGMYSNPTAHSVVRFKTLKYVFLKVCPLRPTEFDKNALGQEVLREDDIEFTQSWLEYHRENAILEILCKDCNQRSENCMQRL